MDAKETFRKLITKLKTDLDAASLRAANELLADISERIYEKGQASDGSKIGKYSERPFDFTEEMRTGYAGLLPVSKVKTGTISGGYKEFREKVGREGDFVNLDLTSSLRLNTKVGRSSSGRIAVGIVGAEEVAKARDNEKRFGKSIFDPTDAEKEKAKQIFLKTLNAKT